MTRLPETSDSHEIKVWAALHWVAMLYTTPHSEKNITISTVEIFLIYDLSKGILIHVTLHHTLSSMLTLIVAGRNTFLMMN